METCFRCDRSEKEVKLLDAIYENDMVKICEKCSIIESIPILRKPSTSQLKESEKSYTVYQRLRKLSGEEQEKKHESVLDQIRTLEEHPELEGPEHGKPFNLIGNFNWEVTRARRNKGLSPRQLGWALGESEAAIKMIERGELPEEPEKLIRKLEQFFQIKLRERTEQELEEERRREAEREEFKIPRAELVEEPAEGETVGDVEEPIEPIIEEPEVEMLAGEPETKVVDIEKLEEIEETEKPSPAQVLSFKPELMKDITIADLKKIKEEQEKQDRLEAIEEEKKKALEADSLVQEIKDEEKRKLELREKITAEMKDIALGKETATISEKKKILGKAVKKLDKKEEKVPTISELAERRKEKLLAEGVVEIEEKAEKKEGKKEETPTAHELAEKKKEESMIGDGIELVDDTGEENL